MTTKTDITLLPCPFCGGDAHFSRSDELVNVRCKGWNPGECLGAGPNCYTESEAAAGWNRRAAVEADRQGRMLSAQDREDAQVPDWMTCESRSPMVVNSLKHNAERLRRDEKRCRGAYKKAFMGVPCHYLADVYGEAAAVFEARLNVIDAARAGDKS